MENNKSKESGKEKADFKPVIGIAIVSLLVCGLFFPLLITAIAQVPFLSNNADGDLAHIDGKVVGSYQTAQNFTLPIFFHTRNESLSASGLDPDITVQMADSQIPGISNATGISVSALQQIVSQNIDPQGRAVELQYVNVLTLNIQLIDSYPTVYQNYT
jgi:K+-transporting ATPase ATPase C chain